MQQPSASGRNQFEYVKVTGRKDGSAIRLQNVEIERKIFKKRSKREKERKKDRENGPRDTTYDDIRCFLLMKCHPLSLSQGFPENGRFIPELTVRNLSDTSNPFFAIFHTMLL